MAANNNNKTWSCKHCTFDNPSDYLVCEVCHSQNDDNNDKKRKRNYDNDEIVDLTKSVVNRNDVLVLNKMIITGTQDNLVTKILKHVKAEHQQEINELIQECNQNNEYNIDHVNLLACKLKKVLSSNIQTILSFSLYWPAFLAALHSQNDSKRRVTLAQVCIGHWSWWIRTAGNLKRTSDDWKTVHRTMKDYGIDIRTLENEKKRFVVLDILGLKCIYDPWSRKLEWDFSAL